MRLLKDNDVKVKVVYEDGYEQRYTEAVIGLLRRSKERRKAAQYPEGKVRKVAETV